MRSSSFRPSAFGLLVCAAIAIATSGSVHGADVNVCALPASALYFTRTANMTASPGAAANATTGAGGRARCWSDSAGVTVDAACVSACSCRNLESETSADASVKPVGLCLNNSASFRCAAESGLADCSAYVLNADGSSTLKNAGKPQSNEVTPATGATTKSDDGESGLQAWVWAIIVIGMVLVAGLVVFTITWFKNRPKYAKTSSSVFERTVGMDAWRDGKSLEDEPRLSAATTAATTAATSSQARDAHPSVVSGVPGVGYSTYRLLDGGQAHRADESFFDSQHTPISRISDDSSSSIEMNSPVHYQYVERRSSLTGRSGERLTGGSRLSYASASSYGSEMDSFSSQLTFEGSEPRETVVVVDEAALQQHNAAYPRKQSTEF